VSDGEARTTGAPHAGPDAASSEPRLAESPVVRNTYLGDRYWHLVLEAPEIAARLAPGQFVMLNTVRDGDTGPVLPRPMAAFDWDADEGTVDIVYGVVGDGTRLMTAFRPRERMTILGPLGRGFDVDGDTRRLLLVGRGIGTCSLTALARQAVRADIDVAAVVSARKRSALIGAELYRAHGVDPVMEVVDSDGSSDAMSVGQRLRDWAGDEPPQQICTCGSERLFRLCCDIAAGWRADIQVSLEAHMACGMGYCHGCSATAVTSSYEAALVCHDGPVFVWDPYEHQLREQ
jgi:dihydroorotate dehydrogenase electron transfer subunit